jgi:hypothetical protein
MESSGLTLHSCFSREAETSSSAQLVRDRLRPLPERALLQPPRNSGIYGAIPSLEPVDEGLTLTFETLPSRLPPTGKLLPTTGVGRSLIT